MENYFVLSNGVKMPKIGFGTYKSTDGSDERVIGQALEAGYRLLDTAAAYKNEEQVGKAKLYHTKQYHKQPDLRCLTALPGIKRKADNNTENITDDQRRFKIRTRKPLHHHDQCIGKSRKYRKQVSRQSAST